ncbi:MAG TPA: hypothetical protein VFK26_13820 [Gemmatimonadaceae bacterium]|nr:hypothetical protein [Gemmatimonadaceae bacterium]
MPTSRIASPTRSWFALSKVTLALTATVACSSPRPAVESDSAGATEKPSQAATERDLKSDLLSSICPTLTRRGSIQVARVEPKVEEGGVAFDLLGDGAGQGVMTCADTLYADVHALLRSMADSSSVTSFAGKAVIDGKTTNARAGYYNGALYVRVDSLARNRRALVLASPGQPTDVVIWPRKALLHLETSGLTAGRAYKTAVSEGLLP